MAIKVQYAVYGALAGSQTMAQAVDVTRILQDQIDKRQAVVPIDNDSMGGDPSPNNKKHFGACVLRDGTPVYFACGEGQTIDFNHSKPPAALPAQAASAT